jgi:type II secretory pathway pseudopilin PulG
MRLPLRSWGFSPGELLIVLGILAVTATVLLLNFSGTTSATRETALKENLSLLREAFDLYKVDHGWYPCDPEKDWNRSGDPEALKHQLLDFTDARGEPSKTRTPACRFGPYLTKWPVEPVSRSGAITIDPSGFSLFDRMADRVAVGEGAGGWHYEPRSGNVCANLGNGFPTELAHY